MSTNVGNAATMGNFRAPRHPTEQVGDVTGRTQVWLKGLATGLNLAAQISL